MPDEPTLATALTITASAAVTDADGNPVDNTKENLS